MAKRRTVEFDDWCGGASEEEVKELIKVTRKKFFMWLLISLIPGVSIFTMGFAIFCYNNLKILEARDLNGTNGLFTNLFRLIMLIYGLFIIPIIEVQLCAKIDSLGTKILGW